MEDRGMIDQSMMTQQSSGGTPTKQLRPMIPMPGLVFNAGNSGAPLQNFRMNLNPFPAPPPEQQLPPPQQQVPHVIGFGLGSNWNSIYVFRFRFRFNRLFFIVIMQLRLRKNICHINKSCFSMNHSLIDHKLTL